MESKNVLDDLFDRKQKFDEDQRQERLLERLQEKERWIRLLKLYFLLKIPLIELAPLSKVPFRDDWRTQKPLSFDAALSWIMNDCGNVGGQGGSEFVICDLDSLELSKEMQEVIDLTLTARTNKGYNIWLL